MPHSHSLVTYSACCASTGLLAMTSQPMHSNGQARQPALGPCLQGMDQAFAALEKAVWGCPWELTDNFVSAMREGRGRLTLCGPGDPTGRGLGFSFWRDERKVSPSQCIHPGAALYTFSCQLMGLLPSSLPFTHSPWLSSWHACHRFA